MNGTNVRDMGHLMRLIGGAGAGKSVMLGIDRQGMPLELPVTLGCRPDEFNR